ncbi:indole-3-acetic acid-induced protein ARG7-like [Prunus dulcis]|uniref:indole-3-acetic acid-induced protein ARG7-like n=1 Tax=Prunus dulcis TaxID=3755 RepID=UPI001483A7C0|nr:indole-3-acetic acid-induced protein ARG7-like [Prunus dulcis]
MGFWIPGIVNAKKSLNHSASSKTLEIPKGHFEVYVGKNQKKRFVIPVSYLNEPLFLDLLNQAEEEFGYGHPMGCITIPCSEDSFVHLTSCLSEKWEDIGLSSTRSVICHMAADFPC